jgi:hypothetical protein
VLRLWCSCGCDSGWFRLTGKSKTHAQYGLAVLGLCVFQGLLGAVRERISGADHDSDKATDFPHGPNRFAFNALHRTNGAFVCLFVCFVFTYV